MSSSDAKLVKLNIAPGIRRESTQYAEEGSWYDANDVLEEQLGITIDRFHNVANVFQAFKLTYDDHKGEAGTDQGVLFYQMAFVGDRWFITNLMWQSETGDSKVAEFVN